MEFKRFDRTLLVNVCVEAENRADSDSALADVRKSIKGFTSATIGVRNWMTRITHVSSVVNVSAKQLRSQNVRILGLFDIQNVLDSCAFEDTSDNCAVALFDWLYVNAPESTRSYLPVWLIKQLAPVSEIVWKELSFGRADIRESYTAAAAKFPKEFAVFVKVETPVRMYFPDGGYESSWGHTRVTYGHGKSYESALLNAYEQIKRMRKGKEL